MTDSSSGQSFKKSSDARSVLDALASGDERKNAVEGENII